MSSATGPARPRRWKSSTRSWPRAAARSLCARTSGARTVCRLVRGERRELRPTRHRRRQRGVRRAGLPAGDDPPPPGPNDACVGALAPVHRPAGRSERGGQPTAWDRRAPTAPLCPSSEDRRGGSAMGRQRRRPRRASRPRCRRSRAIPPRTSPTMRTNVLCHLFLVKWSAVPLQGLCIARERSSGGPHGRGPCPMRPLLENEEALQ